MTHDTQFLTAVQTTVTVFWDTTPFNMATGTNVSEEPAASVFRVEE
jgi:hypothetical protein